MSTDQKEIRKRNLPWNGEDIINTYLSTHPNFPYRDQFIKLLLEAYHSYLAGCPRASIIVASEALLRVLYDEIIQAVSKGKEIEIENSIIDDSKLQVLYEEYSFYDTLKIFKSNNLLPQDLIDVIFVAKDLRNNAAHGELPTLFEDDPQEGSRDEEELKNIITGKSKISEGYKFKTKSSRGFFRFDLKGHQVNTLKGLSSEDKFAAIQNLIVWKLLDDIVSLN